MGTKITFTIAGKEGQAFKKLIQKTASEKGMSVSEFCVEALAEYIRNNK